jgi:glucose/arabinose dehydrogenase
VTRSIRALAPVIVLALTLSGAVASADSVTYPAGFSHTVLASGVNEATAFAFFPDGRIAIAQKVGIVRLVKNGQLLPTPVIDVRDRVNQYWDRGLIGIAIDPDFGAHPYLYLLYVHENGLTENSGPKTSRLTRVTVQGDTADPGTEVVLLGKTEAASCNDLPAGTDCLPADGPSHNGGGLRFGGGTLFVSTGDAADFTVANPNGLRAQNLDSLAGKLLRIGRDGRGVSSNPFWTGDADDNRSKVWAYGFRNPYRFSLKPGSAPPVPYVADVGWSYREEINVAAAGGNYGWPCYEGAAQQGGYAGFPECQALYATRGAAEARTAIHEYGPGPAGACVTGGGFATSAGYPESVRGAYFFADYVNDWIRMLRVDGSNALVPGSVADFARGLEGPVDLQVGPDGRLYYIVLGGELRRIDYSPVNTPPVAVAKADRTAGLRPLTVNFSSAGSRDPDRDRLTYEWDFGDGTGGKGAGIAHTYRPPDAGIHQYVATLTVRDPDGAVAQQSVTITVGNRRPMPTILRPGAARHFKVGDTITFTGSATDADEGALPESALRWQVLLHHCPGGQCHIHPFLSGDGATGTFTVPDHGDRIFFEFLLTATDSGGLARTVSRKIYP